MQKPIAVIATLAAAVNPESTYLKVRHGDWILYVGKGNYGHARVQELEASGYAKYTDADAA